MRTKASIPIIAFVLIVVVIAIILMLVVWPMAQKSLVCTDYDNVYRETEGPSAGWYKHDGYPHTSTNYVALKPEAVGDTWYIRYWDTDRFMTITTTFDEIPNRLSIQFGETLQHDVGMHIWNAIDKGCV